MKDTEMRLISIKEAGARLGVGVWAVHQQIKKRALKSVKIGGRRLISVQTLDEFVAVREK